jgi:hypothetical protein
MSIARVSRKHNQLASRNGQWAYVERVDHLATFSLYINRIIGLFLAGKNINGHRYIRFLKIPEISVEILHKIYQTNF